MRMNNCVVGTWEVYSDDDDDDGGGGGVVMMRWCAVRVIAWAID